MNELKVRIITEERRLPDGVDEANFFHSRRLFSLCLHTPRHKPYMAVVETQGGKVVAQLLGIVRYRLSWFPPYLYTHCRVLGEGTYHLEHAAPETQREELFGMMLNALKHKLQKRVLYLEVSNLPQKMFGYRQFRQAGFFPVHWMSIHNSLHSRTPEERISDKMKHHIDSAYERGLKTTEVQGQDEFKAFSKLLRSHNFLKPKRYIPADEFFVGMQQAGAGRLFITQYKGHVIGCSAVAYSQNPSTELSNNAYLWYAAFRRKSFAMLHPDELTIWHVLKDSSQRGYDHVYFLDVGLPFSKNPFREFILRFGGKPVSTYRWFYVSIGWVNALLSWFYRE